MTSTKTLIIFAHGPAEAVKTHQRYFSGKEGKSRINLYGAECGPSERDAGIPAKCENRVENVRKSWLLSVNFDTTLANIEHDVAIIIIIRTETKCKRRRIPLLQSQNVCKNNRKLLQYSCSLLQMQKDRARGYWVSIQ